MIKRTYISSLFTSITLFFFSVSSTHATHMGNPTAGHNDIKPIGNPVVRGLEGQTSDAAPALFGKWLAAIVGVLLIAGSIWSLFQLLMGALEWISSGGDSEKVENAQGRLRNAIIGLVILFSSWAVYLLILNWLGLTSGGGLDFQFPTLF